MRCIPDMAFHRFSRWSSKGAMDLAYPSLSSASPSLMLSSRPPASPSDTCLPFFFAACTRTKERKKKKEGEEKAKANANASTLRVV
jgi:hypothetical protein